MKLLFFRMLLVQPAAPTGAEMNRRPEALSALSGSSAASVEEIVAGAAQMAEVTQGVTRKLQQFRT